MAEYVDYDYQPDTGGGKFLNLLSKGDKIKVRLADKPITFFVHWVDNKPTMCEDKANCATCKKVEAFSAEELKVKENSQMKRRQTFVWPVIDRADGEAKVFKGGTGIFLAIQEFAIDPSWGGAEKDGTKFDITITRTETSPSKYYSVIPDPASLSKSLTADEKKAAANLATLIDSIVTGEAKTEVKSETPETEGDDKDLEFLKGE